MKTELSTGDILNMLGEKWSDNERKYIIDRYRNMDKPEITKTAHCMITGLAMNLAKEVYRRGGSNEELDKALEYLMVCIDSRKHRLDERDAYEDLKIKSLTEKYGKHPAVMPKE